MRYPPIEDHGLIGDLHTAALVDLNGTIDFFCFPRFDSPTVFAKLLHADDGGAFELCPELPDPRHKQLYLPDTNVLLTRFLADEGVAEITDFMPVGSGQAHRVVRRVRVIRGEIPFRARCEPRFDYARADHAVAVEADRVRFVPDDGAPSLCLSASVELRADGRAAVAEFTLGEGDEATFVLEGDEPPCAPDEPFDGEAAFEATVEYWRNWVATSTYQGRWRAEVRRSALLLKLLTYAPEGSFVAAPTFGLPEAIGAERNWDYRYTWIRDAAFTLYALSRLGFTEELGAFAHWIMARKGSSIEDWPLQIMYGLGGEIELPERRLEHFEGYRGSQPVRIGNEAYRQLQLDIYGALMDTVYLYDKYADEVSYDLWTDDLVPLLDWVCEHWREEDHGIWEIRGEPRAYLSSRLLTWVAVDRGFRLALKRSLPGHLERWRETRDEIFLDIHENFWNDDLGAFVQYRGARRLDASCLLMPLLKFISPVDPRWLSTLRAVERELVEDAFVYRYRTHGHGPDQLEGSEGTFSICSFWYVECLSRSGDVRKARFLFEKILSHANHVGLFAEELGPSGEHLGNFPQAFTHLALISAAYDIDRRLDDA